MLVLVTQLRLSQGIAAGDPTVSVDLGWWEYLLYPVAFAIALVSWLIGVVILNWLIEFVEWVFFCRRKCPNCGSRRWSWGYVRGFGL